MARTVSPSEGPQWDEALLNLIVRTAVDGIIVTDEVGKIFAYSASCVRICQYSVDEAIGRNVSMLMPPRSADLYRRQIEKLKQWSKTGRPHAVREVTGLRKDGSVFPMYLSVAAGQLHGETVFVGILHDLTELHRERQQKEEYAALLTHMVDSSQEGIVAVSADGMIRTFNRAAESIYGYSSHEVVGTSEFALMAGTVRPEHLVEEEQVVARAMAGETIPPYETLRVRKDGRLVHLATSISPIVDEQRRVLGFTRTLRDISEHKAQEERNAFLTAMMQSSDEAILGTGLDGTLGSYNRGAELLYGYKQSEIVGMHIRDFLTLVVPAERESEELDVLAQVYSGKAVAPYETVRLRKDGTRVPVLVSVSYIRDANGRLLGTSRIVRDLTQREQFEAHLRQMREEVARAGRLNELGQVSAGIAHELNQPLAAMMNYSSVARRLIDSDAKEDLKRAQHAIAKATKQAERAGAIIRRMRSLIEKRETNRKLEDMNAIVEDALALGMAHASGITTNLRLGRDLPPVLADRLQIQQVLVNLLRNAVEAMADSPRRELTLSTARCGAGHVQVAVSDTGPGISKEVVDRVFMPFFSTKPGGMGLGLVISQSIVEAHGGQIGVESKPGTGTVFRFDLPGSPQSDAA